MTKTATFPCVIEITSDKSSKRKMGAKLVAIASVTTKWGAENYLAHDGDKSHWVKTEQAKVVKDKPDADIIAKAETAFGRTPVFLNVELTGKYAANGSPKARVGGKTIMLSPNAGAAVNVANIGRLPKWLIDKNKLEIPAEMLSETVQTGLRAAFEAAPLRVFAVAE